MNRFGAILRSFIDVRPGEGGRTLFMSLYLLLVLLAYYILKPVSRALFLNKFDIDKLPYLYILVAAFGGLLAYVYTKVAIRSSLETAVLGAMTFSIAMLVLLWWLIGSGQAWVYYFFNIWVSLFSVMMVSQGWLVAANVFTAREAKRLYGLLGAGSVIGAAFGGEFTARAVKYIPPRDLLLASAAFVVLAYGAFRMTARQKGVSLKYVRGAGSEEAKIQFSDILGSIRSNRHLQVICGIMLLTFIVDVTIEYQFNALAKMSFRGHDPTGAGLTAFLGNFYGIYLNLVTIVLQIVFTAFVVQRIGIGGTLQVMPVAIGLTSVATFLFSGVWAAGALRLTEAATRYTLNRTGMELLYLPLPLELKNRTKAFIDIFVDRFGRGVGGMLLILLTSVLGFSPRTIALVTAAITIPWVILSAVASREYVATVRKRLSSRRLNFDETRIDPSDANLLRIVSEAALGSNPRQAVYAMDLLAGVNAFDLRPILKKQVASPDPEVRAKVFSIAADRKLEGFTAAAHKELSLDSEAAEAAVAYLVGVARETIDWNSDARILEAAVRAGQAAPFAWIEKTAVDPDPARRHIAAAALAFAPDSRGVALLRVLLGDPDAQVARGALKSIALLRDSTLLPDVIGAMSRSSLRAEALEAVAAYSDAACPLLSELLNDNEAPLQLRSQSPRALRLIRTQASVDVLIAAVQHGNLAIRSSVLKALNSIRLKAPQLNFHEKRITERFLAEARYYFELNAAVACFSNYRKPSTAAGLLARTLEQRLEQTLERLFRLLGLRYPPREIYSVYLAVQRRRTGELSAALDFLDSTLDRDSKRVMLPLLDEPDQLQPAAQRLFGVEGRTTASSIRSLVHSGDPWLESCALAAAEELHLKVDGHEVDASKESMAELNIVERVIALESVDLLRTLKPEQLSRIARIATEASIGRGKPVYGRATPAGGLMIVFEGSVELSRDGQVLTVARQNDVLGAWALFDDDPLPIDATALEPTRLLCISRDDFYDLLADNTEITQAIFATLVKRFRKLIEG